MTLKRVQRVINGGWGGEDDNADKNKVEDKKLEQFSDYLIVLVSLKRICKELSLCATFLKMLERILTFIDLQGFTDNPSYFFVLFF